MFILLMCLFSVSCKINSVNVSHDIQDNQKRFLLNDNGNNVYYVIDFIKINQDKKYLGIVPMLIIHNIDDTIIIRSDENVEGKLNLAKKDIVKNKITPINESVGRYGAAGKNGVIEIYTYGK